MDNCRVYWGSHGCAYERGHDGPCGGCGCCDHPEEHDGVTVPDHDGDGCGCVAFPPYYGPGTEFYGEDVEARGLKPVVQ